MLSIGFDFIHLLFLSGTQNVPFFLTVCFLTEPFVSSPLFISPFLMRISQNFSSILAVRFPHHLKCIRKGAFYIFLAEEAFFISKQFSFRLTPLDKTTIRVGFPKTSLEKWKKVFMESGWAFVVVDGENTEEYP